MDMNEAQLQKLKKVAERSKRNNADVSDLPVRPSWRRAPTRAFKASKKRTEKMFDDIDAYFTNKYNNGEHPTLCDMAGAAGFDSVTQMVNHARRNGGEVMRGISRGMLAVAAGYEDQAQEGSRHAVTMLSVIPQFDSEEPAEQVPQRPFMQQKDINLNISGVDSTTTRGAHLTEQEAYLQLIKYKTYEEIRSGVLDASQDDEGDYAVINLKNEDSDNA